MPFVSANIVLNISGESFKVKVKQKEKKKKKKKKDDLLKLSQTVQLLLDCAISVSL